MKRQGSPSCRLLYSGHCLVAHDTSDYRQVGPLKLRTIKAFGLLLNRTIAMSDHRYVDLAILNPM